MPESKRTRVRRTRLEPSPGELDRLETMIDEIVRRFRRERSSRPILPPPARRAGRAGRREPLPWEGQNRARLRRDLGHLLDGCRRNDSPRFWGYVNPPGTAIGALADYLAAALNQNLTSWRSAPGATEVELEVLDWIRQIVGFPRGASGLLTSGGSLANFCGLAAARNAAVREDVGASGLQGLRGPRLVLYASAEAHGSIHKAAALLGIGTDQVRPVPTDRALRLDPRALREAVRRDRRAGLRPFCVVASAGSVNTGAVDPLREIQRICRRERLWLHVDACYGGFALLAPSTHPLLRGIGLADSVALDPHKWLYAPIDVGCILYRNPAAARRAFHLEADYTRTFGSTELENFAFWDYGPELSRRFRALKIWLTFKYHGAAALSAAVESDLQMARSLQARIRKAPRLQMLAAGLSIVCFRYAPPGPRLPEAILDRINETLLLALQAEGRVFVSNVRVRGRFALRACIINYRTTESDLAILIERTLACGAAAAASVGRG